MNNIKSFLFIALFTSSFLNANGKRPFNRIWNAIFCGREMNEKIDLANNFFKENKRKIESLKIKIELYEFINKFNKNQDSEKCYFEEQYELKQKIKDFLFIENLKKIEIEELSKTKIVLDKYARSSGEFFILDDCYLNKGTFEILIKLFSSDKTVKAISMVGAKFDLFDLEYLFENISSTQVVLLLFSSKYEDFIKEIFKKYKITQLNISFINK